MNPIKKLLIICFQLLLLLVLLFVVQATVTADINFESASIYFDSIYQKTLGLFKTLNEDSFRNKILDNLWVLVPLAISVWILKLIAIPTSYSSKGEEGERIVNRIAKRFLDKNYYHLLKNVTLPTIDGTTQIDHIIVSIYGVFIVETKNMTGWIFGSRNQRTWTQIIYGDRYKFQNPLHQNFKHVKTIKSLLRLNNQQLHSVVVFVGEGEFKTEMPGNVAYLKDFVEYVESKQQPVLVGSEVKEIIEKIETERLEPSLETHREHVKKLKNRI